MPSEVVSLSTPDGICPVHVFIPQVTPAPTVVVYMDALAIRPAMIEIARRIAQAGYATLLPDLFYRYGPYPPFDPKTVFAGDFRASIGPLMATTDNHKAAADTERLLAFCATRPEIDASRVATVGFCMGGGMALTAAGMFPDRVRAAASFHGGNLASDAPTSPHLLASKITGEVYVAAADNDRSYPPEMAQRLEAALREAGVRHRCETYSGAAHGWMMPDFPIYDATAAERGWREMLALFERALRGSSRSVG